MTDERPPGFSVNFQREVQAMLFLLNWTVVTREEVRKNLPKLGMDLITDPKPLPPIPDAPIQVPLDDSYPMVELHNVPDDVINFIDEQKIPDEVLAELPNESFESVENIVRAIHDLANRETVLSSTEQSEVTTIENGDTE